MIQSNGSFEVRTSASKSGIDPGEYAVFVLPTDDMEDGGGIPQKYRDQDNPEILATVSTGQANDFHLELRSTP